MTRVANLIYNANLCKEIITPVFKVLNPDSSRARSLYYGSLPSDRPEGITYAIVCGGAYFWNSASDLISLVLLLEEAEFQGVKVWTRAPVPVVWVTDEQLVFLEVSGALMRDP